MSDQRPPGVLDSLPRTRPHRRSDKRARAKGVSEASQAEVQAPAPAPAAGPPTVAAAPKRAKTTKQAKPAKPARQVKPTRSTTAATPVGRSATATRSTVAPAARDETEPSHGPVETAVQAAAELAEIGLHASARALRGALSRLPRP